MQISSGLGPLPQLSRTHLCYSMALGWTLAADSMNFKTTHRLEYLKIRINPSPPCTSPYTFHASTGHASDPQHCEIVARLCARGCIS
jgi:hypothetical protein